MGIGVEEVKKPPTPNNIIANAYASKDSGANALLRTTHSSEGNRNEIKATSDSEREMW